MARQIYCNASTASLGQKVNLMTKLSSTASQPVNKKDSGGGVRHSALPRSIFRRPELRPRFSRTEGGYQAPWKWRTPKVSQGCSTLEKEQKAQRARESRREGYSPRE